MSWTSHAYHVAKDFQTAGTALIALGAAAITYAAQRRTANLQAQTARDLQEREISIREHREAEADKRLEIHFLVNMDSSLLQLGLDLKTLLDHVKFLQETERAAKEHMFQVATAGIHWKRFLSLSAPLSTRPIFDSSSESLSRLSVKSQRHFLRCKRACTRVDVAVSRIKENMLEDGLILKSYFFVLESFIERSIKDLEDIEKDIAPIIKNVLG